VQALARASSILSSTDWKGAPLGEIFNREFGNQMLGSVVVTGCDIVINAEAALQFALIVHELATNALKYGALSVPEGSISVSGSVTQDNGISQFSLKWTERGGPRVAVPVRKGFGNVILFDLPRAFGMQIDIQYDPAGLIYTLSVPIGIIASAQSSGADSRA
jgi:two-component sensor histidine kinase